MSQFTVYQNKNPQTKKAYPYFVDIQSNLLEALSTTVVIPLCSMSSMGQRPITKLCPIVEVQNRKYVVLTQQLAGIDKKHLGAEVSNLAEHRQAFIAAIDFVISGI